MYSRFTVGDTFDVTTALAGYPASAGWVLKLRLIPRAGADAAVEIASTPDGDSHRLLVAAAVTAAWVPGDYSWAMWVELGGASHSVGSGALTLAPNPRTTSAVLDLRTDAQRALEDARAALAAWKPTNRRYKINGREMEFNSADDILKIVAFWEREVRREQNAAGMALGQANRRKVFARVGRV